MGIELKILNYLISSSEYNEGYEEILDFLMSEYPNPDQETLHNIRDAIVYLNKKNFAGTPCLIYTNLGVRYQVFINNQPHQFNCLSLSEINIIQQNSELRESHNLKTRVTLEGKAFVQNKAMQDLITKVNQSQIELSSSTVTLNEKTGTFYDKQTNFNNWQKGLTIAIGLFTLAQVLIAVFKKDAKTETIQIPSLTQVESKLNKLEKEIISKASQDSLFYRQVKDSLRIP